MLSYEKHLMISKVESQVGTSLQMRRHRVAIGLINNAEFADRGTEPPMADEGGPARRPVGMSHPRDNFDTMMNYSTDEPTAEMEAFAAAERALREAGIEFTVVEESFRSVTERPIAA